VLCGLPVPLGICRRSTRGLSGSTHLMWAEWLRGHARDPTWMTGRSSDRYIGDSPRDSRGELAAWIQEERDRLEAGTHPLTKDRWATR
jgi:hypothetical protein